MQEMIFQYQNQKQGCHDCIYPVSYQKHTKMQICQYQNLYQVYSCLWLGVARYSTSTFHFMYPTHVSAHCQRRGKKCNMNSYNLKVISVPVAEILSIECEVVNKTKGSRAQ